MLNGLRLHSNRTRNARPRVVVAENVTDRDRSVVGPLDGLLRRTAAACGYTLRGGDLDPGREFGSLAHRDRLRIST